MTLIVQHACSLIVIPGVTIGFNSTVYSVSEGTSSVSVTVSIFSGILARNAYVKVHNRNDSAQGNFKFSHFKFEIKVNHSLDMQSHSML